MLTRSASQTTKVVMGTFIDRRTVRYNSYDAAISWNKGTFLVGSRTDAFTVSFPEATMVTVGHIQMAKTFGLPNFGDGTIGSAKIHQIVLSVNMI